MRSSYMRHAFVALTVLASALVGSSALAADDKDKGGKDHDKVVGRLGIGYLGLREIAIGSAATPVPAPVIGARYWMSSSWAIQGGIGIGWVSGSTEAVAGGTSTTTDKPNGFAMAFHGGVPISLAAGKHTSFQVIPEFNIGFGTGSTKTQGQPDQNHSGFLVEVGGRVGLELQFGFIGVPELSLIGSVGLYFHHDASKTSQEVNGTTNSQSQSNNRLGTTVGANPWAIFTNSIAAIYYF